MKDKIRGFDGIRGLAVISVVLTHMHFWKYLELKGFIDSSIIPLVSGWTGVQAFFILSGFLITTLLIKEYERTGNISIKNFIIRRTLRIFPLYILFLLVASTINYFGENVTTWESLGYAYLYIYNFIPYNLYTSFLGHTWSLAVEEHFYLVWPFLFLLFFLKKRLLLISILIVSILGSLVLNYYLRKMGYSSVYFIERWSFIAGYNISFGCLAAIFLQSGQKCSDIRRIFKKSLWLIIGVGLYLNTLYLNTGSGFIDTIVSEYIRSFGILLVVVWLFLNQESFVIKLLEFAPLRYVGVISYGIYIYQGLFLATGPERFADQDWPLDQSIGVILLLITAPLSYHYYEKPILKLKHRFSYSYIKV